MLRAILRLEGDDRAALRPRPAGLAAVEPDRVGPLGEAAGAKVEESLPTLNARVLSFPEVKRDPSRAGRERDLEKIKEDLAQDPAVESVKYNYLLELAYTPDDPKFHDQWGLRLPGFEST